eukprot:GHVL01017441.1.p1 GENE.GHVL01017441.1~~GHVL01017441.1.p1  ORF type:complete len:1874 (-),score=282.08 GHVL01017441.1:2365-7347(-)
MAPFKPAYIPCDDHGLYSFFFEPLKNRRRCYLSPERFYDNAQSGSSPTEKNKNVNRHYCARDQGSEPPFKGTWKNIEAMDVFSIGCCILELLLEGSHVFDLSEILSYRQCAINNSVQCGGAEPAFSVLKSQLEKLSSPLPDLLVRMLSVDPDQRGSVINNFLSFFHNGIFPRVFSDCYYPLFCLMLHPAYQQPDLRLTLIRNHLPYLLASAVLATTQSKYHKRSDKAASHLKGSDSFELPSYEDTEDLKHLRMMFETIVDSYIEPIDSVTMESIIAAIDGLGGGKNDTSEKKGNSCHGRTLGGTPITSVSQWLLRQLDAPTNSDEGGRSSSFKTSPFRHPIVDEKNGPHFFKDMFKMWDEAGSHGDGRNPHLSNKGLDTLRNFIAKRSHTAYDRFFETSKIEIEELPEHFNCPHLDDFVKRLRRLLPSNNSIKTIPSIFRTRIDDDDPVGSDDDYIIHIIVVLSSLMRHLLVTRCKVMCIMMMSLCATLASSSAIMECLYPYLLCALHDESAMVRAAALEAIGNVLRSVHELPKRENPDSFQENLLPTLLSLAESEVEPVVRFAMAVAIVPIAVTGQRFIEFEFEKRSNALVELNGREDEDTHSASRKMSHDGKEMTDSQSFDEKIIVLRRGIQGIIDKLLCSETDGIHVKLAILEHLEQLAHFFGSEWVQYHLMTRIITLGNESSWQIRSSYCKALPTLARIVGRGASDQWLWPCLEQSLDKELEDQVSKNVLSGLCTFIAAQNVDASPTQTGIDLLTRSAVTICPPDVSLIRSIAVKCVVMLIHPGRAVRMAAIRLFETIQQVLTPVLWVVFIQPLIEPFLKRELITSMGQLRHILYENVSRSAFNQMIEFYSNQPSIGENRYRSDKNDDTFEVKNKIDGDILKIVLSEKEKKNIKKEELIKTSSMSDNLKEALFQDKTPNDAALKQLDEYLKTATARARTTIKRTDARGPDNRGCGMYLASAGVFDHSDDSCLLKMKSLAKLSSGWRPSFTKISIGRHIAANRTARLRSQEEQNTMLNEDFLTIDNYFMAATKLNVDAIIYQERKKQHGTPALAHSDWRLHALGVPLFTLDLGSLVNPQGNRTSLYLTQSTNTTSADSSSLTSPYYYSGLPIPGVMECEGKTNDLIQRSGSISQTSNDVSRIANIAAENSRTGRLCSIDKQPPSDFNSGFPTCSLSLIGCPPVDWIPKGWHIATLYEHAQGGATPVVGVKVTDDSRLLVTADKSGVIKIWNPQKIEQDIVAKSLKTLTIESIDTNDKKGRHAQLRGDAVNIIHNSKSLVVGTFDGEVLIYRIDHQRQSDHPLCRLKMPTKNDLPLALPCYTQSIISNKAFPGSHISVTDSKFGTTCTGVTAVEHFETDLESVIVFCQENGNVLTWDIRTPSVSSICNIGGLCDIPDGLALGPCGRYVCASTNEGKLIVLDLRFNIPLAKWKMDTGQRILKCRSLAGVCNYRFSICVALASETNEVAIYDVLTGGCSMVLRTEETSNEGASKSDLRPPRLVAFSNKSEMISSLVDSLALEKSNKIAQKGVRALWVPSRGYCKHILTAGTDKLIRSWNVEGSGSSVVVVGDDETGATERSICNRVHDGVVVKQEESSYLNGKIFVSVTLLILLGKNRGKLRPRFGGDGFGDKIDLPEFEEPFLAKSSHKDVILGNKRLK